ncbi:MAG: TonB-dependent receptor plug domain-containing protein, partial [Candidatus Latescibacteria bacterium]|nr:TonB-dependent receptor plug domain-containing protein [Candidatus Latescibacterota bacterium]
MKRVEFALLLMGALLFMLPQTGFVQELGEEQLPLYWMDEIVVTATRTEKTIRDLSATVSVITREEIEASNAHSPMDILNTLPGLFVQRTGAFGRADVDIRGIGERGRKVMVLVDGRPVKMGLFGCTVTHSLPLNNVERIEVVRGPASVLYGSDALGGVINIITRKLAESQQVDYTFSYGSYDTYQHRVRAGGSSGPLTFYATADKRQSDGHLPNMAYDGRDFTAQAGYEITDHVEAMLTSKYFEAHKEEPLRATDPDTLISDVWNDYERGAVDLTFTGKWARWNGSLKLYRNFG